MTSNLGSTYLTSEAAQTPQSWAKAQKLVMNALQAHFKPEFLNRVDDVVIFNPLTREQLTHIVELRLEDLRRLLSDRRITIELTDAARELIFTEGYDPAYGARPLKRSIQRLVQDPLAMKILDGEVLHGDNVIVDADLAKHEVKFRVAPRGGEKEVPVKSKSRK
jgi:ATP-dependent Clp protease ATP-binding subunit ClpB